MAILKILAKTAVLFTVGVISTMIALIEGLGKIFVRCGVYLEMLCDKLIGLTKKRSKIDIPL